MGFKHEQASMPYTIRNYIDSEYMEYTADVTIFDTNFTVPSTGIAYYAFNEYSTTPGYNSPSDTALRSTGTTPNCIFDWADGVPVGVSTSLYQVLLNGLIYGYDAVTAPSIDFKVYYKGSIIVSVDSDPNNYSSNYTGQLSTTSYVDWKVTSDELKVAEFSATGIANSYGALAFRLRFWNSKSDDHLVIFVRRNGIDDDYRLLSASCVTNNLDYISAGSTIACDYTTISAVNSFSISKGHDKLTIADIELFVENTTSAEAYDRATDTFGMVSKGKLISIAAGTTNTKVNRFIGNITSAIEVGRNEYGSLIKLKCESILARTIDTLQFNFPSQAMYSYADYTSNNNYYTEPNGVDRPTYFDQWDINKAIEALIVASDIDPIYVMGTKKYYQNSGSIYESSLKLMVDLNITLSRKPKVLAALTNVNYKDFEPIWEYDFGQDTAYDVIKDMLSKYGYYIFDGNVGDSCGYIEIVTVDAPTSIVSPSTFLASSHNYTANKKVKGAEKFMVTELGAGESELAFDWTGKGVDLVIARGPSMADDLEISYKVGVSDADWTGISGYINNGVYTDGSTVHPVYNSDTTVYYYDGINLTTGVNPTVYRLVFGVDSNNIVDTDLDMGVHSLRLFKSSSITGIVDFDMCLIYDYGELAYRKYSTKSHITTLSTTENIADLRNEVTVLGASTAGFAFTADETSIPEIKSKYIFSKATDTRSIYDSSYKYYIGKRKAMVIEEPTIVTQERADWLALYTLDRYRKPQVSASIKLPMDYGLNLYHSILVNDVKTGMIDYYSDVFVYTLKESYSSGGYTLDVNGNTFRLPYSFRKRTYLTRSEIDTYFNGSPIAFEEMTIPLRTGATAYNPMDSDAGKFIELSWVLLTPAIQALEIFDTRSSQTGGTLVRNPVYGAELDQLGNSLIAVPYVGKTEDYPGIYSAKWDGVHQNYDLNDVFKSTIYKEVYKVPNGNGFFARGQNTLPEDKVDPISVGDNILSDYTTFFPVYPVIRIEPIVTDYEDIDRIYMFGTKNGISVVNGVTNTTNDETFFDISHFYLDERVPLVFEFNEDYINYPTDASNFVIEHTSPYTNPNANFQLLETFDAAAYATWDNTPHMITYSTRPPYGWDGSRGYGPYDHLNTLPVIDETVSIRLYEDGEYVTRTKYLIKSFQFHIASLTLLKEWMQYIVNSATARVEFTYDIQQVIDNGGAFRECYFLFSKLFTPVNAEDLVTATMPVEIGKWDYITPVSARKTNDAIIFSSNFTNNPTLVSLAEIPASSLNNKSTLSGIGCGRTFACNVNDVDKFDPTNQIYTQNLVSTTYREQIVPYSVPGPYPQPFGVRPPGTLPLFSYGYGLDTWGILPPHGGESFETNGYSYNYAAYDGTRTIGRSVRNACLVGVSMQIIDRAGRSYYVAAKEDPGNFLIGKHNVFETHNEVTEAMLKYVNRYNPFVPLAVLMERDPANTALEDYAAGYLDSDTLEIKYETNKGNLSKKIINGGIDNKITDPMPYGDWDRLDGLVSGEFIPEIWSVPEQWYNSYVFTFEGIDSHGNSRNSRSESLQSCYGLPIWYFGVDKHNHGSAPEYYKALFSASEYNYLVDKYETGGTYYPDSVRAGMFTFLNRLPIFVNCGTAIRTKSVIF